MQRNLSPPSLPCRLSGPVAPPPSTLTHPGGRRFLLPLSPPPLRFRPLAPSFAVEPFFCAGQAQIVPSRLWSPHGRHEQSVFVAGAGAGDSPFRCRSQTSPLTPAPCWHLSRLGVDRFRQHRPARFDAAALRNRLACPLATGNGQGLAIPSGEAFCLFSFLFAPDVAGSAAALGEGGDTYEGGIEVPVRSGIGEAQVTGKTERAARHQRHVRLLDQRHGEIGTA